MIITRTPYRISFVGGGSDLPAFFEDHGGSVINVTFKRYMYVTLHPTFNPKEIKIKYAKTEIVEKRKDIEHPVVKAALELYGITNGVEITSVGDIPAQTGLGSSSSFTVGLLKALSIFQESYKTQSDLANEACHIEIEMVRNPVGKQDQYAAAVGGLNQFIFHRNGSVEQIPIFVPSKKLDLMQRSLLLFYTGITRSASKVLNEQNRKIGQKKSQENLSKMVQMTYPLREDLENGKIESLGEYLHENWKLKKELAGSISSPQFDKWYDIARKHGAIGGKILGAGGGGFFLFYCPLSKQADLKKALQLNSYPVEFDFHGTREVYRG